MSKLFNWIVPLLVVVAFIAAACGSDDAEESTDSTGVDTTPAASEDVSDGDAEEPAADTEQPEASDEEAATDPEPVVVESCGIDWTYEDAPERVLALDTNALEVMFELDLEDRVVGYFGSPDNMGGRFAGVAAEAGIENLGPSFPYPGLEAVLAEDPDFVFSYGYNPEAGFTAEAMLDAGIGNYAFDETCPGFNGINTIESLYENIRDVATIFGVEDRAETVIAGYEERLDAVAAMVPDDAEAPQMFLLDFGEDSIFTAAQGAIPTDLFARAGGVNVFGETVGDDGLGGTAWMYATFEEIVERDPEVIVLVDYGFGGPEERQEFAENHPALSGVTGVAEGNFIVVKFPQIVPSPENIDTIELLAESLWGG